MPGPSRCGSIVHLCRGLRSQESRSRRRYVGQSITKNCAAGWKVSTTRTSAATGCSSFRQLGNPENGRKSEGRIFLRIPRSVSNSSEAVRLKTIADAVQPAFGESFGPTPSGSRVMPTPLPIRSCFPSLRTRFNSPSLTSNPRRIFISTPASWRSMLQTSRAASLHTRRGRKEYRRAFGDSHRAAKVLPTA